MLSKRRQTQKTTYHRTIYMKYPEKALGLGVRAGIDIKLTLEKLVRLMKTTSEIKIHQRKCMAYYTLENFSELDDTVIESIQN